MEGQILIFICVVVAGQVSGLEIDHWGRHFVLSFIRIENMDTVQNIVAITARETTEVRVVFHQTGAEEIFSITSGNGISVECNHRVTPNTYTTVSTNMAISVESSKPVSVYGYVYYSQKSEGFLVLPVASLGTSYMTVTYEDAQNSDDNWNTQIVIIAVEDDTDLTIVLPEDNDCLVGTYEWEEKRNFMMDSYDVVNIMCEKDTTGSLINSTKPIAVLSGAKRIRLDDASYFHTIVEMLPPITEFGTEYKFVTPSGHTRRCMLRVLALHPDTTFDFKEEYTLSNSGKFVDIFINQSEPVCFITNKPVIVALFMTGSDDWMDYEYIGNAFMSIIPPVTKFSNDYMVPTYSNYYNHFDIIGHKNNTGNVYVPSMDSIYENIYLCDDYVVSKFKFKYTYSGLFHFQSTTPFLALVYGYALMDGYGYGFPAGMKLTDFSESDECISSPCQNGGWCLEVGLSFRCYCPYSRDTGDYCETELVEPDQNNRNGTVVDTNTTPHFPTSITAVQSSTVETSASSPTPTTHHTTFTTAEMTMITTIMTDASSTEQPTITTDTPSTEQPTVTTDTPSTEQPTITTDTPSTEQPTVTTDTPSTEQTTITTDTPSTEQPTVTTDTPSTEQTTITTDTPSTEQPTVTTDTPSTDQPTFITETASTKQPDISQTSIKARPTTQLTTSMDGSTIGRMPTTQTGALTESAITTKYSPTYKPTNAPVMNESKLKPKPYCNKMPCMCSCPCKKAFNSSRALESIKEIRENLKVDKTLLSKTFRKKNSIKNLKIVEEEIGQSVFIIVMFPFACLVLSDLCKIVYWLLARRNRRTLR